MGLRERMALDFIDEEVSMALRKHGLNCQERTNDVATTEERKQQRLITTEKVVYSKSKKRIICACCALDPIYRYSPFPGP
jgi:hypothetical protein